MKSFILLYSCLITYLCSHPLSLFLMHFQLSHLASYLQRLHWFVGVWQKYSYGTPCYSKYVPWPPVALAPPETLLEMQTLRTFSRSAAAAAKSLQLCLTLCDPIDGSPPGSPIPGILQARTLEWVAISFSNA